MKYEKKLIIITTLLTFLPAVFGLLLWNKLPDQLPVHWNAAGEIDGYLAKPAAVFGMPAVLALIQLFTVFVTGTDPKNPNVVKKVNQLVLWIVPAVSLLTSVMVYPTALGQPVNANTAASLFVGILFVVIGNYLPKCRPNYTIGIKLPWTLADDENWTKTHRMAGPVYMAAGLLILLSGFVLSAHEYYVMFPVILLAVLCPMVYSYLLYRKKANNEA